MKNSLSEQAERLLAWLFTWKTASGAYHGYVVHRGNLKRMKRIHDTPWTQAPIIEGLLNQFERSGDERWLSLAHDAATLQASRFDWRTGRFRNAGFEDDRFSSLVHNALAGCALLRTAAHCQNVPQFQTSAESFRNITRELADRYFIGVLYNPDARAFRFNEVDFYSPRADRYTTNMNSVAVEMLLELYRCTGEGRFLEISERVGEWMLTQVYRCEDKKLDGGLLYQQTVGERGGENTLVSIYTALALRGLLALYRQNCDIRYRNVAEGACRHLMHFITPEGYFAHQYLVEKNLLQHYPCWIAGAGLIFKGLDDVATACGVSFDYQDQLTTVLKHQLPNGAVENFYRYRCGEGDTWEDVVPIVGWNAHLFEFLSRKVTLDLDAVLRLRLPSVLRNTPNFFYWELGCLSFVFGKRPYSSRGVYLVWKKMPRSIVALG